MCTLIGIVNGDRNHSGFPDPQGAHSGPGSLSKELFIHPLLL